MTQKREDLLAKIRALLSKTIEAGCTEGEAMLALQKARAMMDVYDVSDEELQLTKEEKADAHVYEERDPHDASQPCGIDLMPLKGNRMLRDIMAGGQQCDIRITVVPCLSEELATAVKEMLGEREFDA
jgi:hypothetical protein